MIKLPAVKNFIILNYKKTVDDEQIPEKTSYTKEEYRIYLEDQEKIFQFSKHQIHAIYPNAHIHVLTNNKNGKDNNYTTHHYDSFPPNHAIKFRLFSLLNEPAMYLDNDVEIVRKFQAYQLPLNNPFNCYAYSFTNFDLQARSQARLPCLASNVLNGGVIWIPWPSQAITDELIDLHHRYFDDKKWLLSRNMICNNDELALTLYTCIHKLEMRILSEVNCRRGDGLIDKSTLQTIHYTTVRAKKLMFRELPYFSRPNQLPSDNNSCQQ